MQRLALASKLEHRWKGLRKHVLPPAITGTSFRLRDRKGTNDESSGPIKSGSRLWIRRALGVMFVAGALAIVIDSSLRAGRPDGAFGIATAAKSEAALPGPSASIDHSIVKSIEADVESDSPGASIAAYGL